MSLGFRVGKQANFLTCQCSATLSAFLNDWVLALHEGRELSRFLTMDDNLLILYQRSGHSRRSDRIRTLLVAGIESRDRCIDSFREAAISGMSARLGNIDGRLKLLEPFSV